MEFSHFLSSYYPGPACGGTRLFADMVEQATMAERLGYRSVTIPEHHLINIQTTHLTGCAGLVTPAASRR